MLEVGNRQVRKNSYILQYFVIFTISFVAFISIGVDSITSSELWGFW